MKFIDLTGQKFNRLTVNKCVGKDISGNYIWECLCDCKNLTIVISGNLRRKHTQSCGCFKKEFAGRQVLKHGYTKTKTYRAWRSMKSRCNNPNVWNYKNYGGRGIKVCERWLDKTNGFKNFLEDMGEIPKNKTLDKINNNDNYCKENCRLITSKEQARNQRSNRIIPYNGQECCFALLSEKHNINPSTLAYRLDILKWPIEKALTTPIRKHKKYKKRIK